MKLYRFKSIQTRLIYWFLLLTLLPLLTVLVITYFQRVNVIESRTYDKLTAIRDLKVERLQDWIGERKGDMFNFSADKELTELEHVINETSYDEHDLETINNSRRILTRCLKNYPTYHDIFIINPTNGKILVSTNRNKEGADHSEDEFFTNAMQSKMFSLKNIYQSKTIQENTMAYSIPMFCSDHGGEHIIGIFVARIVLKTSLYKTLQDRVGLGETGETIIVNKDVMALNELRWAKDAPLKLKINAKPAIQAAKGKTGIITTTDYRGEEVMAAYTYLPETEWGFVCKQDLYELNAPIREMVMNFLVLFIVSAALIFLIAYGISKTISKPIIAMDDISQKMKAGDFSVRNKPSTNDELGSLALAFNDFADVTESRMNIQNGVAEISDTMLGQQSMEGFGAALLNQLMKITDAHMSTFYILNEGTSEYEHFASVGANKELLKSFNAENPEGEFGIVLAQKSIYYLQDIPDNTLFRYKTTAGDAVPKEIITIPILIENNVAALISLVNIHKFSNDCIDILEQSWSNINFSYSNLISTERTAILADSLSTANQQMQEQTNTLEEQNKLLEEQKSEIEVNNKELEAFSYSVSHDLRAPLTRMGGFSRALEKNYAKKLDEKGMHYLDRIKSSSQHMANLIDDLLGLSRISRKELKKEVVSLSKLTKEILASLQSVDKERKVEVKIQPDVNVTGDAGLLKAMMENLLNNAWKFTGDEKVAEIDFGTVREEGKDWIFVKDNGTGFDMKYYDKLFVPFQRLHSDKYEGSGIGLSTVQRIVTKHGGEVRAQSKPGKGTTFYFII